MPDQRGVWLFADADVFFYLEQSSPYVIDEYGCMMTEDGTVISGSEVNLPVDDPNYIPPLFSHCYLTSGEINAEQRDQKEIFVPGRQQPYNGGASFKYGMSIEAIYFDRDKELRFDDVFTPNQKLRIAFRLKNYTKNPNPVYHVLQGAKISNFRITGSDDQNVTASMSITAEDHYIL